MRSILCAAMLALSTTAANAQMDSLSANAVLPGCIKFGTPSKDPDESLRTGLCVGTVTTLILTLQSKTAGPFCIRFPRGATFQQAVQIVVRYAQARPERMHELFALLAHEALLNAWPCKP
jgi:hypothetical protein